MNHLQIYNFIQQRLVPVPFSTTGEGEPDEPQQTIEPIPCETFADLCEYYESELELTQEIRDTLACMLAVVISTEEEGGQLALRVIGPPGSAKSTLSESVSVAREWVYPCSKFTGIISGWHNLKKGEQLADKINGKCLIIKDADSQDQLPNRKQIESELRDALGDGVIRGTYKTGKELELEAVFTLIKCGTKALRSGDDNTLGSRYLDVVIHEEGTSTEKIVRRSIKSQFSSIGRSLRKRRRSAHSNGNGDTPDELPRKKTIDTLAPPTYGLLQHMKGLIEEGEIDLKDMTQKQETRFLSMGELIAYCRARVERDKGNLLYRPEKELATRLAEQLTRLALFLSIIFLPRNRKTATLTKEVFRIVEKVMRDTCYSFNFEIVKAIFESDRKKKKAEGMDKQEIAQQLGISVTQTYEILCDMKELKLVSTRAVSNIHGRGRKSHYYILTPEVKKLCRLAFTS